MALMFIKIQTLRNNIMTELTRKPATNSTYPKVAIKWLNQMQCFYQSLCLVDSESSRNRNLQVATNRYASY